MTTTAGAGPARICTLLVTDFVGSTHLTESLGDARWASVSARCDAAARRVFGAWHGREIDKSDGFLILFDRPIDAVRAALAFHREMQALGSELGQALDSRAGIHLGEVILRENTVEEIAKGAKPVEVDGLAKPMAARLMGLAGPRQTLVGAGAFELARRAAVGDDSLAPTIQWRSHGPYSLKGIEDPVEVLEVGEDGVAPLAPPPDSEKARSLAMLDHGMVMGWRPSVGADVPSAPGWTCIERLGAGAFGEVWKVLRRNAPAEAEETRMGAIEGLPAGTTLAFKFCFDLAHARALRREATLFKLIQKTFGQHPGVVTLIDFQLERAPLFLAMEWVAGKNVGEWLEDEGRNVPLALRLKHFARVAQTIAEVHDAGIIIADIKPSNILVRYGDGGMREFVLADLGIGRLREKSFVEDASVTKTTGFTKTSLTLALPISGSEKESGGGTLLYLAPEVMEGAPPSVTTDAYAFGVTLFQVAAGNARLAVSDHWRRHVRGGPPRQLIGKMLKGDPRKRLADFRKIERTLRRMPTRMRVRKVRNAFYLALLALVAGLHVWWFGIMGPRYKRETIAAQEAARALGLPTTEAEFNAMYPITRRGEAAVMEACQIFRQIDWAANQLDQVPGLVAGRKAPLPVPDSPEALFEERTGWMTGSRILFDHAAPVLDSNRHIIDRYVALHASGPPVRELAWKLDFSVEPPLPPRTRALGRVEDSPESQVGFLQAREAARVLVPAAMAECLRGGRPRDAYSQIMGWHYSNRAIRAQGTTLVDAMIGIALDNLYNAQLIALMEAAPPSADESRKLLELVNPDWALENAKRGGPYIETLGAIAFLEWCRGERDALPFGLRGSAGGDGLSTFETLRRLELASPKKRNRGLLSRFFFKAFDPYFAVHAQEAIALEYQLEAHMYKGWTSRDRLEKKRMDDEFENTIVNRRNIFISIMVPGFLRASSTSQETASREAAIATILRLRLLELEAKDGEFIPPSSLAALDALDHRGIPEDYTKPEGTVLSYEVLPDLRAIRLSHGPADPKDRGDFFYWATWGDPFIDATITAQDSVRAPSGKGDNADPLNNRLYRITARLASGRELTVVCGERVAQAIGFPEKFAVGSRVRLARRPLMVDGNTCLEIATTQDIEVLP